MVAGHLHEKNGYYYIILNLTDMAGRRKPKWIATGLPVKGNKKRAEQLLVEARRQYDPICKPREILFADYMEQWLEVAKSTVSVVTYSSYSNQVKSIIAPYFRKKRSRWRRCARKTFRTSIKTSSSAYPPHRSSTITRISTRR